MAVAQEMADAGARRVMDIGAGDGELTLHLARQEGIDAILAVEPALAALSVLRARIGALTEAERRRVTLMRASAVEGAALPEGQDAAALVEVIEHLPPQHLSALEARLFARARPGMVVITTPNADLNTLLGTPAGRRRHRDHRFEWGRDRFARWARGVAGRQGYRTRISPLGPAHPDLGAPSQMAVFTLGADAGPAAPDTGNG